MASRKIQSALTCPLQGHTSTLRIKTRSFKSKLSRKSAITASRLLSSNCAQQRLFSRGSSSSSPRSNSTSAEEKENIKSTSLSLTAMVRESWSRNVRRWTQEVPHRVSAVTVDWLSKWTTASSQQQSTSISSTTTMNSKTSITPSTAVSTKVVVSKSSLDARTRHLLNSISIANCNHSRHRDVEELCKFLRQYPVAQSLAAKAGAVRLLLLAKESTRDPLVLEGIREALVLVGFCKPPSGWGIRILSIDGGGLRGIMALEILKQLEELTSCPVHKMFDYICGVSTGAVLSILLGSLQSTVSKCENMYKKIGSEIFTQNKILGTSKLVFNHAFYDTDKWAQLLRTHVGDQLLVETARDDHCPKIATISTIVNRPRLEPFVFRNYEYPRRVRSLYSGTPTARLWEAIRASAAAPGYFEEFKLGDEVHQDGGILVNNPTALAIHECKHLWPNEVLQCVVSIGSGRYEPQKLYDPATYTGLKNKLLKIVDSATDTEAVHTILHDLLPPTTYFRFNPYLSENLSLDETREEKICQMQEDAKMYLRRNETKLKLAASLLMQPRTRLQTTRDYVMLKANTILG